MPLRLHVGQREFNLSVYTSRADKGRVEGLDLDDTVLLVVETESAEQALNLNLGVGGPDTDVVSVLVGDAGVLSVEFDVNAVAVSAISEEFASDGDR